MIEDLPDSEIEFREQLIQEREGEIEQIEQGITELNQIFKDLAVMVNEQGSLIGKIYNLFLIDAKESTEWVRAHSYSLNVDNIYSSVSNVVTDTGGAAVELRTAEAYQRRAGKRMFCLFLVFLVVLSVVLLAVSY